MDKLLNAVKDFPSIIRCLEAINQITDDFLYMYDFHNNTLQFFGHINDVFHISDTVRNVIMFDDFLRIVHPSDSPQISAVMDDLRRGVINSQDINFRMFNIHGKTVWVNSRGKVLHDENGAPFVMIGRLSEEALRHLYNPLTGLSNKTKLRMDLETGLKKGKGWLMLFGIPTLASINLTHGKSFGNELLCEMADILSKTEHIEESYHIENNNFAAVISECSEQEAIKIYEHIISETMEKCTVYAGIIPIDNTVFSSVSQLIDSARITLQNAMQDTSGELVFFSTEEINKRISDLNLLEELKESIQNGFEGFEVWYQPQIKSMTYQLYGTEALLRYNSPKRGRVFPDEFIPILEHSGLIDSVGMWVLDTALAQCKEWRKSIPDMRTAVNFSSVQFDDIRLGEKIIDSLSKAGLPGDALTVELTESVQLNNDKRYQDTIRYIKSFGVRFSIDDFGTGYSNLVYLKQIDASEVKIDRSFVSEIEKNSYNYHLIGNVIEFAKNNSIHVCCEGVETVRELSILEPMQADFFQGYLFDKPCTAEEIEQKYINISSEGFKARENSIKEINRFKEQYGTIHFNPNNILRANDIGLWIIRYNEKAGRRELYADSTMERVLGLSEKLSPSECFEYWYNRIQPEYVEYLLEKTDIMVSSKKAIDFKYKWDHPKYGVISVRGSGICMFNDTNMLTMEGYFRLIPDN